MRANRHPSMLVYDDTETFDFPIVLILGHEFNGEGDVTDDLGNYNWADSPHSLFWNTAYKLVGEVAGFSSGMALKSFCSIRRSSPIVFTNALPIAIPNELGAVEKSRLRRSVPENRIRDHARFVVRNSPLLARPSLVLLSGADGADFARASSVFQEECSLASVPLVRMPYLASRQPYLNYRRALSEVDADRLRWVVRGFRDRT